MYEEAAAFVHFFRISPEQFWDLDMPMYRALRARIEAEQKTQSKARGDTTLAAMAAKHGRGG